MANQETQLAAEVSAIGRKHFGHDFTYEEALVHVKTVKIILAADGISETENWAFKKALQAIGAPEALQKEAEAFDPTDVKLEEALATVPKRSQRARELIRAAIRVASADGYSVREREKVMEAGALLGLEPKIVYALEAVVELEGRIRDLGDAGLREQMVKLSLALITPTA